MLVYRYDGTSEGLFTAFAAALAASEQPDEFSASDAACGLPLFGTTREVATDPSRAAALGERLRQVDRRLPGELMQALLGEETDVESLMFRYLRRILDHGGGVRGNLADPVVNRFQKTVKRVASETHRYKGLIRFEELADGLLWANYEPSCNITILLVPHFAARLRHQRWVVCDVARGLAVYYDGKRAQPVEIAPETLHSLRTRGHLPGRTRADDPYAQLWREYFSTIAIAERTNLALQRQLMPKRFWKWLPEKMPPI